MGYIFDELGGQNGADDVTGYCGVIFLGHTVDTTSPPGEPGFAPREWASTPTGSGPAATRIRATT